jgi:hypothetical protein
MEVREGHLMVRISPSQACPVWFFRTVWRYTDKENKSGHILQNYKKAYISGPLILLLFVHVHRRMTLREEVPLIPNKALK